MTSTSRKQTRNKARGGKPPHPLKGGDSIEKKPTAKERYDAKTAVYVSLKLNNKTDGDILEAIADKPKQTEIKRLIRQGLAHEQK